MKINKKIAVLVSGEGGNLKAIIEAQKCGLLESDIVVVLSDRDCNALNVAKSNNIPAFAVITDERSERESFFINYLTNYKTDYVILSGYAKILSKEFVKKHENRILNIHPSLLPDFPGMDRNVHEAVLKAGCKVSGCTVHLVDEGVDSGRILAQEKVNIDENETVESLRAKIKKVEDRIFPETINKYINGGI